MKICPQCGVELDEIMTSCPLCNPVMEQQTATAISHEPSENYSKETMMSDYVKLTKGQKRKLFWEMSGIILFSGILVTLIIDFVSSGTISWSRYSITICLVLFVNITLLSFLRNRLFIMLLGSFISTSLLLVLLDMYNNKIGWGTQLGVPILIALYCLIFILALLIRNSKHQGFNIIGYFFTAIGLFSMSVEGIVNWYITQTLGFHWSLIVFVSIIPIAAILFFIHYRLKKGIELKRFFHI